MESCWQFAWSMAETVILESDLWGTKTEFTTRPWGKLLMRIALPLILMTDSSTLDFIKIQRSLRRIFSWTVWSGDKSGFTKYGAKEAPNDRILITTLQELKLTRIDLGLVLQEKYLPRQRQSRMNDFGIEAADWDTFRNTKHNNNEFRFKNK